MNDWNRGQEPISERLRDDNQLSFVQEQKMMMYHKDTGRSALIMDVWWVEPVSGDFASIEEDRYIRYTTGDAIKEDYSVDLDDEGWLWCDELEGWHA